MRKVRLGIIGCGVMGTVHLKSARACPLTEVVAVADVMEDRARTAAEEFEASRTYIDGDSLLDDETVEAVVLAMPTCFRTPLALKAFERGKHVLTEKPVAMNAGEVEKLISAKGKRVGACCSSRYRFRPSASAAAEFIAGGALGSLRVVHARELRGAGPAPNTPRPDWRLKRSLNGGGILMNWGCYDLDYVLGVTGWSVKPRVALAETWRIPPQLEPHIAPGSDAETHFAALILCEGKTVISFERGEYVAGHGDAAWQILGTKGSLRLDMTGAKGKRIVHDSTSDEEGLLSDVIWEGDESAEAVNLDLLHDFASAVLEGHPPKTTLEQSLIVQKISDAIYASADQGKAVEIR